MLSVDFSEGKILKLTADRNYVGVLKALYFLHFLNLAA